MSRRFLAGLVGLLMAFPIGAAAAQTFAQAPVEVRVPAPPHPVVGPTSGMAQLTD